MTEKLSQAAEEHIQLVTDFIVELRGRGHFLPYSDYEIIRAWVEATDDIEKLLVLLSDVLPPYFGLDADEESAGEQRTNLQGRHPKPLTGIRKRVLADLRR